MIVEDIIRDSIMVNDDTQLTIVDRGGHVLAVGNWYNDNVLKWSNEEILRYSYDGIKNKVRATVIEEY